MKQKRQQSGVILMVTLYTALLMAVFIVGFIGLTTVDLRVSTNHAKSMQAYYIAEAGVADALAQMRQQGPLVDTHWTNSFPPGSSDSYAVTVSQSSGKIESRGQTSSLGFTRSLEVAVAVSGSTTPYVVRIQEWKEVGL